MNLLLSARLALILAVVFQTAFIRPPRLLGEDKSGGKCIFLDS